MPFFSLYEALSNHPTYFDELYRNLVKAGESAGVLDTVLEADVEIGARNETTS